MEGTFIVIEGTDGSGKNTQFKLLADRLRADGYDVATFDFPRYDKPSSHFVKEYLNGVYGGADEVSPYTASLFYALDRFEAANSIRQALGEGKVVLANRFSGSNMGHQGTKFQNAEERRGFFIWADNLEFEMLKIPRPDISIVLRVPAETAQQLVDQKEARSYTNKKRDIHEADLGHLQRAVAVYDELCELFPKDFVRLDCVRSEQLMPVQTIQELLWQKVQPLLPERSTKIQEASVQQSATVSEVINKEGEILNQVQDDGGAVQDDGGISQDDDTTKSSVQDGSGASRVDSTSRTSAQGQKEAPLVAKNANGSFSITPAGKDFLSQAVTNTTSNVYTFTDKLSPITIAAAMARLSRRGDDMRVTILDEFATKAGKDQKLLKRVITAFGDDSVQQLVGQYVVVENASNLLTKKLEWGRLAAYLEQSTRYIYYDQKDVDGRYKYFVPEGLGDELTKQFVEHMDAIFDLYSGMVHGLSKYIADNSATPAAERDIAWKGAVRAQACDAIRPVLPVATKSTVGVFASGQALESLIMHLLSDELPEARTTGQAILDECRKVIPTFLERADKPDRGGAWIAYRANIQRSVKQLADAELPDTYANQTDDPVQLTDVWPRNELDLVPDMLYEHSNLPLKSIRQEFDTWPYAKRLAIFDAYVGERLNRRHRPGRALEKAHYSWDLVCDYGIFRDLQRHRMVDDLEWQMLTPRYGFDVPKLVEDAGMTEQFEQCFDLSLKLHSLLEASGHRLEAQYATLLGHKMRWKVTYNAREAFHLHELRTTPQGHPGYRKLVKQMHDKLTQAHPLLGEAMKFVNQGEDPKLTRLAAERYTQFKLQQLEATDRP